MLDCSPGWMKFSGNCYQFNSEKLSWQAAQHQCSTQKADLVSIHSELENNFTSRQVNPKSQRFWIGSARKTDQSTEWTWTDGSSFDYHKFCPGKPDNKGGHQNCLDIGWMAKGENCTRDTWDDQPCDQRLPFICKKSQM